MFKVLVLGSAAGGGFPQWNCNCDNCSKARAGDPTARPRTQSSLAVTADGKRWVLLNASPDLRQQIFENAALHPQEGLRHTPISAAVLTNADIDHSAGLLTLRESQPFALYATPRVLGVLAGNSVYEVVNPEFVPRRPLSLNKPEKLVDIDNKDLGLTVTPFAIPGKVALYLEDDSQDNFGSVPEDTIGLEVTDTKTKKRFFYLPGCAAVPNELAERLMGAELVFMDGTTWTDDEMIRRKVGHKTGQRMGHMAMNGPEGTIDTFSRFDIAQKVFIHINNTNPVLLDDSPERAEAEAAGWVVAHDGLEITP